VGPSCGQMTALRRDGLIRLENNGRTMLCDDLSALRLAAGETALD
jgi:CRP/FNR family transcriptional regulator